MSSIHVQHYERETIFCEVSPASALYTNHIIYVMYDDGSYATQYGTAYNRSKPGILRKPRGEYTLTELQEVIHGKELLQKIC